MLKDHNAVTPVRLKPAALWSQVKHSTTEPLRSHVNVHVYPQLTISSQLSNLHEVSSLTLYLLVPFADNLCN